MPYKDPAHKAQWEREHREQRNARRRMQPLAARSGHTNVPKPSADPVSTQQQPGGWKVALTLALGVGLILLGALGGVDLSMGNLSPPRQSGNTTS